MRLGILVHFVPKVFMFLIGQNSLKTGEKIYFLSFFGFIDCGRCENNLLIFGYKNAQSKGNICSICKIPSTLVFINCVAFYVCFSKLFCSFKKRNRDVFFTAFDTAEKVYRRLFAIVDGFK